MLVTAWLTPGCYIITVTFSVGETPFQAHFRTLEEAHMYLNSIVVEYAHEENFLKEDEALIQDPIISSSKLTDDGN